VYEIKVILMTTTFYIPQTAFRIHRSSYSNKNCSHSCKRNVCNNLLRGKNVAEKQGEQE